MESFTVTTTIDRATYNSLKFLAGSKSCSASELAAEAIRIYIDDQSRQTEAIKEGIRHADAGKFASAERVRSFFSEWGVNV